MTLWYNVLCFSIIGWIIFWGIQVCVCVSVYSECGSMLFIVCSKSNWFEQLLYTSLHSFSHLGCSSHVHVTLSSLEERRESSALFKQAKSGNCCVSSSIRPHGWTLLAFRSFDEVLFPNNTIDWFVYARKIDWNGLWRPRYSPQHRQLFLWFKSIIPPSTIVVCILCSCMWSTGSIWKRTQVPLLHPTFLCVSLYCGFGALIFFSASEELRH